MTRETSKPTSVPPMSELRDEEFRLNRLGCYNAERARGLLHTKEWQERMAVEQAWFDDCRERELRAQGGEEISPGLWLLPAPKKRWWQRGL